MKKTWSLLAATAASVLLASGGAWADQVSGGMIDQVRIARSIVETTTTSTTYVNLPGAKVRVTIPAGKSALVMARFSGESTCYCTGTDWCSVQIFARKIGQQSAVPLEPYEGLVFSFDRYSLLQNRSMDRSAVLGSGKWLVQVQYAVIDGDPNDAPPSFTLDDWSLTVERALK